jgi:hypothetical protein
MLYERTALSRKPAKVAQKELAALREEDRLSTDLVLRDPYLLDFLGLKGAYQEHDLEAAILREMEQFILELGSGFAFLSRQKRFTLDGEDFHIDLLFYQRDLVDPVAREYDHPAACARPHSSRSPNQPPSAGSSATPSRTRLHSRSALSFLSRPS